MTTGIAIPASIEEIIQRFDSEAEPYDEFAVSRELSAARGALNNPSDGENSGAWGEVLAFSLATGHHGNPWNSFFGPNASGVNTKGETVYFPDITGTPPEVVTHWAARSIAQAPLLKIALRGSCLGNEWPHR